MGSLLCGFLWVLALSGEFTCPSAAAFLDGMLSPADVVNSQTVILLHLRQSILWLVFGYTWDLWMAPFVQLRHCWDIWLCKACLMTLFFVLPMAPNYPALTLKPHSQASLSSLALKPNAYSYFHTHSHSRLQWG